MVDMKNDRDRRFTARWVVWQLQDAHPTPVSESRLLDDMRADWPRFNSEQDEHLQPEDLLQPVLLELEEKRKIERVGDDEWRSYRARGVSKADAIQRPYSRIAVKADTWIKARMFKPIVLEDDDEARAVFIEIAARYRTMSPQEREKIGAKLERDDALVRQVKKDRGFQCQVCGPDTATTFVTKSGENYVEAHHMDPLANGGADIEANLLVLCATCHKKFHFLTGEPKTDRVDDDTLRVTLGDKKVTINRYRWKDWERQEGHGE